MKKLQKIQSQELEQELVRFENVVVDLYKNNVCKAKYIEDKQQRKTFLYDLIGSVYLFNLPEQQLQCQYLPIERLSKIKINKKALENAKNSGYYVTKVKNNLAQVLEKRAIDTLSYDIKNALISSKAVMAANTENYESENDLSNSLRSLIFDSFLLETRKQTLIKSLGDDLTFGSILEVALLYNPVHSEYRGKLICSKEEAEVVGALLMLKSLI